MKDVAFTTLRSQLPDCCSVGYTFRDDSSCVIRISPLLTMPTVIALSIACVLTLCSLSVL